MSLSLVSRVEQRIRELGLPLGVRLWNGSSVHAPTAPKVTVTLRSPRILSTLIQPSMGRLARGYVEQEFDVDGNVRDVLRMSELLSGGRQSTPRRPLRAHVGGQRHNRRFDAEAIRRHYDVDDDFFGLWLDARRVYSCAYFRTPDDTLDTAQEQKLDHICRKLLLKPGDKLLDIGCGWGALVLWAAEHYGVVATGITLSRNQYDYARARIADAGLQSRCSVRLMDYRDVPEDAPYDKIASVGMFEHVGCENLGLYFQKIARLLRPGGLVLNHGITLNEVDAKHVSSDIGQFIDEYVFPGGELTHVSRVIGEMSSQGLEPADVESLRPHYASTLWHWVERLESRKSEARAHVGEKAYRIWRIYMAGSAYAFERGWMSVYQIVAGKPLARGELALPLTREHLYSA
jgi:cyclopropane-fatty-acyl-phospholipid synthase